MRNLQTIRTRVRKLQREDGGNTALPIVEILLDEVEQLRKMSGRQYLTFREGCAYTGYNETTLRNLVKLKKIPYYKPVQGGSGRVFLKRDELDEYMGSCRVASLSETETAASNYLAGVGN